MASTTMHPDQQLALMRQAIEDQLRARALHERQPQGLFAPIDYTLRLGGKRLRPLLCCVAAATFSPEWQRALPAAAALEIFHNFTLLHDDLMDRSPLRRGQETVFRRWGDNTAILSGDAMSIEAYASLAEIEEKALLGVIVPLFSQMALEVCIGQQLDMEFETRSEVRPEEYMEMIRLKTSVLLGASLQIGALIGGAQPAEALRLYEAGVQLGLAFQIQDDLLDVYGDEQTFGKPIGGDIIHAKKTLLLLYTLEQLQGDALSELHSILALSPEERVGKVDRVRQLYDEAGTRTYAEGEVQRLTDKAFSLIDQMELRDEGRSLLLALFHTLSGRTK
ncbi:polyprenyl synthetase family protein [Porphyromonas sp. oral taxon 278]|uniref:polyprenyl synthetase family protein n=1 Tax=Porphyromonas sp. oral taxon 278 TaxID=712437 RepID=UPI0025D47749|nr:polyprenyl synthetase family protein [Porphyromonas sp. oral taxon 278]